MKLDLESLREKHPRLSPTTAATHLQRAALGLQRRHRPGVELIVRDGTAQERFSLSWREYPNEEADQIDRHRITEDGADAIALTVAHAKAGLTVLRRLQRDDYADWLLIHPTTRERVAFEVSGTDDGDDAVRIREKVAQVSKCRLSLRRTACVVRFREPRCTLMESAR